MSEWARMYDLQNPAPVSANTKNKHWVRGGVLLGRTSCFRKALFKYCRGYEIKRI